MNYNESILFCFFKKFSDYSVRSVNWYQMELNETSKMRQNLVENEEEGTCSA